MIVARLAITFVFLSNLLMGFPSTKPPLPDKNPADFINWRCDIQEDTENRRWPNITSVDIKGLKPTGPKGSEDGRSRAGQMLMLCREQHSICLIQSEYDSMDGALKSCRKWMKAMDKTVHRALKNLR